MLCEAGERDREYVGVVLSCTEILVVCEMLPFAPVSVRLEVPEAICAVEVRVKVVVPTPFVYEVTVVGLNEALTCAGRVDTLGVTVELNPLTAFTEMV